MDITKVIHVYDAVSNVCGVVGFLFFIACGVALGLSIAHLLSGQFIDALVRFAIAAVCFIGLMAFGKMIQEPTIRYEVIISDMEAVENEYYIISAEDDGTYIVEPKQDGGAE